MILIVNNAPGATQLSPSVFSLSASRRCPDLKGSHPLSTANSLQLYPPPTLQARPSSTDGRPPL
jgi:hypothetical protein